MRLVNQVTESAERSGGNGAGSQRRGNDSDGIARLDARFLRVVGRSVAVVLVRFQQEHRSDVELRDFVKHRQRQHHKYQSNQQIN